MLYKYNRKQTESTWINYNQTPSKDEIGFVYKITNISDNRCYIGIKKFWSIRKLRPLKGKKRTRKVVYETDWRTYNSSGVIREDVEKNPNNYKKEILRICSTVSEMKAYEAYYQLQYYINGEWDKLYNEMINLRLRIR